MNLLKGFLGLGELLLFVGVSGVAVYLLAGGVFDFVFRHKPPS